MLAPLSNPVLISRSPSWPLQLKCLTVLARATADISAAGSRERVQLKFGSRRNDYKLGQRETVSRVRFLQVRRRTFEYEATPHDTTRLNAVGY